MGGVVVHWIGIVYSHIHWLKNDWKNWRKRKFKHTSQIQTRDVLHLHREEEVPMEQVKMYPNFFIFYTILLFLHDTPYPEINFVPKEIPRSLIETELLMLIINTQMPLWKNRLKYMRRGMTGLILIW